MQQVAKAVDVVAVMTYSVDTFKRLNAEASSCEDFALDIEDSQAALDVVSRILAAGGAWLRANDAGASTRELGEAIAEFRASLESADGGAK